MMLQQSAEQPQLSNVTAPHHAQWMQDAAADGRTPGLQPAAEALGLAREANQSRVATLDLPEAGRDHDEAVVESRSIRQAMRGNIDRRSSLLDAIMVTKDQLPQPAPAPVVPAIQRAPSLPAWADQRPDWMPGVNANPVDRSGPWHGRTNGWNVSAKDSRRPRSAIDRLEMFRALYSSLHFLLKETPGEIMDIDLSRPYTNDMRELREELLVLRIDPADPNYGNTNDFPQAGEDWFNYVEDWDVAGHDQNTKDRILSNWNDPAREIWKAQRCPLLFHPNWVSSIGSQRFLNEN